MTSDSKFGMLRKVLRVIGLSQQASDDVVNFIVDLLAGEGKDDKATKPEFPYHLRDDFLSPAERSFFSVLQDVVGEQAVLCTKVGLNDLFWVKHSDPSRFRVYTNKIDRKHVDFVLCDPVTMQPLVALELDDKSHQRADRQERDAFVDQVFQAAGLPLLHVSARRGYRTEDLATVLAPFLTAHPANATPTARTVQGPMTRGQGANGAPLCPKCGCVMVQRTAKSGANAGKPFWGCPNFPNCRSVLPYAG